MHLFKRLPPSLALLAMVLFGPLHGLADTHLRRAGPVTVEDQNFWSFRPLARIPPPAVRDATWARTPVDQFILAKLETQGLSPSPAASRGVLVRRLFFDLIGLPPTPAELERAMTDPAPDWYEQLVDRLLASPHYGERWGRHWLDVARFSESDGYEADGDRPTAWNYRDFVVGAFNSDLPFDRFVQCQLAGDEIEPGNPQARIATGFLAAATSLISKDGTRREKLEWKYNEWDDMVATTGSAMLGLTVGCARCHDHKYDPIPTRDYYKMVAAFVTTKRSPPPEPKPGETPKFSAQDRFGEPLGVVDASATPVEAYLLARGDVDKRAEVVTAGVLSVLTDDRSGSPSPWKSEPNVEAGTTYQRTALARWMTDTRHGAGSLLARVIVNRLWQHHFGEGIVRTPSDFGAQGERPTHPELLDWLASELVQGGWRIKPLHRLIVTSSAYRQGVAADPAGLRIDPDNRLLWRRRPVRLEAEPLRDAILAASGKLDLALGGPSIKSAIAPEAMAGRIKDGIDRPKEDSPEQWRRTIYLFAKRSLAVPSLSAFDAPDGIASCARRNQSTVAPQALYLMNDPFVRRQAGYLAQRCLDEANQDTADRVRIAYRHTLARAATDEELLAAQRFLGAAPTLTEFTDYCQVLLGLNEFMYVD